MKAPPAEWKAPEDATEAFSAALSWLDAQTGRPPQEGVAAAEAFVRRRPQSGLAHLLLAMSSSAVVRPNPGQPNAGGSPETQHRDAARLAPNSLLVHAAYGLYLERQHRPEEALAELAEAQRIDPDNSFVLAMRLRILADLRPEAAVELGERLTREASENAAYWFHYAGALRTLGRNEEAVRAAQASVRFAAKEQCWYRGRLADTLARCGAWPKRRPVTANYSSSARNRRCSGCGMHSSWSKECLTGTRTCARRSNSASPATVLRSSHHRFWTTFARGWERRNRSETLVY